MSDSNAALLVNPEFLDAERRQFACDRMGIRQLGSALDRLTTRSLRKFAELITGDPLLRQVLLYRTVEPSYAALMERAAHAAVSHADARPHEQEALYAAALVAQIPDWIDRYGLGCGCGDLPALQRRCDYFMNSALLRLHASEPRQAAVVFSALGVTHPSQVNNLHSDRLPAIVRQSWREAQPVAGALHKLNEHTSSSNPVFTTL